MAAEAAMPKGLPTTAQGALIVGCMVVARSFAMGMNRLLDARGDAQFALGDHKKAQEAYLKALGLVDVADPQHRLLTLKLIEAGGTPPHTEDKT